MRHIVVLAALLVGGSNLARGPRIPRVRQAKPTVDGSLTAEELLTTTRRHLSELVVCYLPALEEDPNSKGRVQVAFEIDADGRVRSSRVERATLDDAGVAACVASFVLRWRFPPPPDGKPVRVSVPFVFSPG